MMMISTVNACEVTDYSLLIDCNRGQDHGTGHPAGEVSCHQGKCISHTFGKCSSLSSNTKSSYCSCEQGLLLPFVIPLGLVYFAEYFINQGLVSSLVTSGLTLISLHAVILCEMIGIMSSNYHEGEIILFYNKITINIFMRRILIFFLLYLSDGAPVFSQLFLITCGTVSLVSKPSFYLIFRICFIQMEGSDCCLCICSGTRPYTRLVCLCPDPLCV